MSNFKSFCVCIGLLSAYFASVQMEKEDLKNAHNYKKAPSSISWISCDGALLPPRQQHPDNISPIHTQR